jgi:hypothetical protein
VACAQGEDDGTERKKVVKGMSEKKLQKWIETNEKKGKPHRTLSVACPGSCCNVAMLLLIRHCGAGVIYMSRIPPFMRPAKVRDLLAPYGEVGRIYLKPEGILLHCVSSFSRRCPCRFRSALHDRAHSFLHGVCLCRRSIVCLSA